MKEQKQREVSSETIIGNVGTGVGSGGDGAQHLSEDSRQTSASDDTNDEEFADLRCSSLQTEYIQKREQRRNRQPSAGYPGLAFDSPMFSGTIMKFSLIANELKNIQNVLLKRV